MWAPGGPAGPAGWDRRRVGARLRAALAGLHELQGLRARQQARVRVALAVQPPPAPVPRPRAHEVRLEAALAALQEQLNHLRCQDVGLKTHLDQLDQQISELQLDVCRTSIEGPDSDSRPSSGFYELSDGGSCSLSASCTSVCSDRLSSSPGTLLPAVLKARASTGDCRPWSADETTMCGVPRPTWRLQATDGAGQPLQGTSRPRPVSTGDLERVLPAAGGVPKASANTTATSLLWHGMGLPPHVLDPKYQHDLVSKGGREVYAYPSPLHAVALQSPLFALTKETPQNEGHPPLPSKPLPGPSGSSCIQTGVTPEAGPARAYIDRLLELRGRGTPLGARVGEPGPPGCKVTPSLRADSDGHPERLTGCTERAAVGRGAQRGNVGGGSLEQQVPVPLVGPLHRRRLPEEGQKPSSRCICVGSILGSPRLGGGSFSLGSQAPGGWEGKTRPPTRMAPGPCVHPHSVASRAVQKTGSPTTKAMKIGRMTSDKALKSGRQLPPWGALLAPQPPSAWGSGLRRRPAQAREAPGRSCSESSLYPVSFLVPLLVARREGHRASAQALFPLEATPPVAAGGDARRRQRRWQSSVEISARAHPTGAQGPGLGPPRLATRRWGGPRPACGRARLRLPRRDPQARSESGGSEHSAECASLFHSTIAETSEDGASDHTASCFGDRESSGSDTESRVRGTGSCQAWPGATPQQPLRAPALAQPPLSPVPKLCRVKASKALKKKIRRFQPAALKVMTLV